jgi:uncharacterized protein (DUF1501 family)
VNHSVQGLARQSSRRDLLKLGALGVCGGYSGWLGALAAHAAEQGRKHKSCILLWMDGGPSHVDTFDPKPDAAAEVRGDFKAIQTSTPGVLINEKLTQVSQWMNRAAILRGMSTDEADHGRARVYMHSGYKPGLGGVTYPGLGSTVAAELGQADFPLPNFVATGTPLNKYDFVGDPGFRGPRHAPLSLYDPSKGLDNLKPAVPDDDFQDRADVLQQLEGIFARTFKAPAAEAHQTTLASALRLMKSDKAKAFDLSLEPAAGRTAYGDHFFGRGCLLARRLVQVGVPFVEVYLSNWDGHGKQEAERARGLLPILDAGMATLLRDLKDRGLLDSTLVIWMGEFGRTPRMNREGGRDHYARAWSTVLAGGGVKGGQVIGKTDATGSAVTDRPISVRDFMATVCQLLGIDPAKKVETPDGRPISIVDKGYAAIKEVIG